jgi:hypothetical protein
VRFGVDHYGLIPPPACIDILVNNAGARRHVRADAGFPVFPETLFSFSTKSQLGGS